MSEKKTTSRYEKKLGRTIQLCKTRMPDASKWVRWLEEHSKASAGPRGSLRGMRDTIWGTKALIVRAGTYLYLIADVDDGRRMPWE